MEKEFRANFVFATSDKHYYMKKYVHKEDAANWSKESADYFKKEGEEKQEEASLVITEHNIIYAMVEPFWHFFEPDEKLEIIKLAMKRYGGEAFKGCKKYGLINDTVAPVYTEDDGVYFNTTALKYDIDPCIYLTSILSAQADYKQFIYDKSNKIYKNILEVADLQELKTAFVFHTLDMQLTTREQKNFLKKMNEDRPIARAHNYAILDAANMLIEAAADFTALTSDFIKTQMEYAEGALSNLREIHFALDATDEELAYIQKIEYIYKNTPEEIGCLNYIEEIENTLQRAARRRDAKYVLKVNEYLNNVAREKKDYANIISDEKALAHFGFSIDDPGRENVLDKDKQTTEDDEPTFMA